MLIVCSVTNAGKYNMSVLTVISLARDQASVVENAVVSWLKLLC